MRYFSKNLFTIYQNVLWLEVPMYDIVAVYVLEALRNLFEYVPCLRLRQPSDVRLRFTAHNVFK